MLTELRIRNFAIIEEANLHFGPGLNVLSGETGAGKTIIMTALGLLLGERGSPELVRSGAREAVVEGAFELEGETLPPGADEWVHPDSPRELLVRRVLNEAGRARVAINDNLATVQALGRLGADLVQIYGQHEQQSLQARDHHLAMLDRHAGLERQLAEYQASYAATRELQSRLQILAMRERERGDRLEMAQFRLQELEGAALEPGEDERLSAERSLLANTARLIEAATGVEQLLYAGEGAAVELTAKAEAQLRDAAALDRGLTSALELVGGARASLEEAAHLLRGYASRVETNPARLDALEERILEINRLKRKYGGSIESALAALDDARREIGESENAAAGRAEAAAQFHAGLEILASHARRLSLARRRGAADLARRMNIELKTLGMRNASFEARLSDSPAQPDGFVHESVALGPSGAEQAEFFLAPNLGQPAMPLARIASGGELSRVMLALKRLEAQRRGVATLIFDEVDAGIGGAVAEIVGRKLKELARYHQILCVTHLAQVAAFADTHFVIEKEERRGATRSHVTALLAPDRAAEIARMLGGDQRNDKFVRAARELVARAAADAS